MADIGLINREMVSFCKVFAKYLGGDDPRFNSERLFHSMFREETFQLVTTRQKNLFRRFCKKLVEQHQYFVLLGFVYGAIALRDKYDLAAIYDQISQVKIREDYSLAQLCQDFVREVQGRYELREQIPEDADLYHDCPEGLKLMGGGREFHYAMASTLMKQVYQLDYNEKQLRESHIDALVAQVRQKAEEEYAEECADRRERNQENDADSAKYNHPFPRYPMQKFTDFNRDHAIPGLLKPFLTVADLNGDQALRFYILEQYVMPALAAVPWEQTMEEALPFMAEAVHYYADYLQVMFYKEFPLTEFSDAADPEYLRREFYYEAIGKSNLSKCLYTGEGLRKFSAERVRLFSLWADVLDRGGKQLKNALAAHVYSFYVLHVPFVLFFGGEQEKASGFLLRHYGDMRSQDRCKPHYPLLLARGVLAASDSAMANALYGLFSYELGKVDRARQTVLEQTGKMLDFLQDARDYILEANEHTLDDKISWFQILFGDGARDAYFRECRDILANGELLPARRLNTVYQQVRAFSHPTGVHLGWLGLPRYDDYDKLHNALSGQLIQIGQSYWDMAEEIKAYNVRAAQAESLRNIDLHLQNHLFKLQRAEVTSNLARVRALKLALPEDASEDEREKLVADISAIANDLASLTMGSSLRPEAERKITALRQDFEEKYLQGQVDLMQKLPEKIRADVHNYLVTSMMVFSMMESREDDTLDYSAALISMTKALELVMVHIYSRLDIQVYEGMDAATQKYYFRNGQPIDKQTLRPCIETLKGEHYKAWGGESVLDMSLLNLFGDITVLVGTDKRGNPKTATFSPSKEEIDTNRNTLRLSLGYVCENYRNRSAHPDVVTLMQVKECQQLLIDGQKLLWIVLATLKEN